MSEADLAVRDTDESAGSKVESADAAHRPACGMVVKPAEAAATRTVGDTTYSFCSTDCAETFDQDAKRYAGRMAKTTVSQADEAHGRHA